MKKEEDDRLAQLNPLLQKNKTPWTTDEVEQAIKPDWKHQSRTSEVHCGLFPIITGNKTDNSNILILFVLLQNHFIGSVAIERVTLV